MATCRTVAEALDNVNPELKAIMAAASVERASKNEFEAFNGLSLGPTFASVETVRAASTDVVPTTSSGKDKYEQSNHKFDSKLHDGTIEYDYNDGSITEEEESKLRFVMQVIMNQGTSALAKAGKDFTRDSEAWIAFFAKYPFLFSFRSRQSKTHKENDFELSVNAALLENLVDARAPSEVKEGLLQALKSEGGKVIDTSKKETNVEFMTLMRKYSKVPTLTIYRAELRNKVNEVKTLCANSSKVNLNIVYDEVVVEMNYQLGLGMYEELLKVAEEEAIDFVTKFFKMFAKEAAKDFEKWLESLGEK